MGLRHKWRTIRLHRMGYRRIAEVDHMDMFEMHSLIPKPQDTVVHEENKAQLPASEDTKGPEQNIHVPEIEDTTSNIYDRKKEDRISEDQGVHPFFHGALQTEEPEEEEPEEWEIWDDDAQTLGCSYSSWYDEDVETLGSTDWGSDCGSNSHRSTDWTTEWTTVWIPEQTPDQTPDQTLGQTSDQTPDQTKDQAPNRTTRWTAGWTIGWIANLKMFGKGRRAEQRTKKDVSDPGQGLSSIPT